MNINITYNKDNIDWQAVNNVIIKAGLSSSDTEKCKRSFIGSQVAVFAFDNEKLVGVSRAISDGVKQAAIYDVAILPEYQGLGIGRLLIEGILNKLPDCSFILFSNIGKESFYEKFGFRLLKSGMAKFTNEQLMLEKGII
ncbi:MAG: GNAT family N-acetyltransferase [Tissierellia bacterium]|nr:GNAT family N-acetyltransferase [Tissierellia bacterium]